MQYTNNSVVTITDIGTGSAALLCITANSGCCSSANPTTQWYFPNGTQVPNLGSSQPSMTFSRTRSTFPAAVRLNHNPVATTTGVFRCDILDASGDLQSLYVGVYTATTGESCTLCTISLIPRRSKNRRERLVHTVCACGAPQVFLGNLETSVKSTPLH